MSDADVCYFGYGSLVNRDTRPHDEVAIPATLKGWRRVWSHRVVEPNREFACTSLNVEPMQQASIDGVLVRMPLSELETLDFRERGYVRVPLSCSDFELAEPHRATMINCQQLFLYCSRPENTSDADHENPILQSYVDCVMAGFERLFGAAGLTAFLRSTHGWQWPRVDDRGNPYYPRAVPLDAECHRRYDRLLSEVN